VVRWFMFSVVLMMISFTMIACGRPAQIGADKDVFNAVDALFTAVSLRDPTLVDQCETRLNELKSQGKLPDAASKSLASIIEEARRGEWEPSQERLRKFMLGQRR
jgi:hypothetical protein